jgi:predicted membrane metal-binding protein
MVLGRRELSAILLALAAIIFYLLLLSASPSSERDLNC